MANRNATSRPGPAPGGDTPEADPTVITDADVADGLAAIARTYTDTAVRSVVVLDGYGVTLRVSRGELECADGIGDTRRVRRVARADAAAGRVRRVLLLGDGMVTTEAMSWCTALGVALIVAGPYGELLAAGGAELYGHGGLRRAQALAAGTGTGMTVTRWLLGRRLGDQARIVAALAGRPDRAGAIGELRATLRRAGSPAEAMLIEAHAAEAYWSAWADECRLRFAARDARRVPARWRTFGGRVSPLAGAPTNRHAATPANALLNYGYRLAEAEAVIGCRALGLDPAMGLAHADGVNRPAFALDLVETARGLVEETVWRLTAARTFRKADFAELTSGQVRVLAPLSHDLAHALLPALRATLAPVVEQVADMLAAGALRPPTALTRSRHRAARADRGGRPGRTRRTTAAPAAQLWACPDCGGPVADRHRLRCDTCLAADPAQTPELRGNRGKAIATRKRAQTAWAAGGGTGGYDPGDWAAIRAGLVGVKLSEIIAATGLSKSFASTVRAGASRPHPQHWAALAALAKAHRERRP